MPHRWLILAGLVSWLAVGASPAIADPDPENNKNALVRTLECDDGQTVVASFAGLEGSNFNVTTDERVFVYKWIQIDRPPVGVGRTQRRPQRAWPAGSPERAPRHVRLYDGSGNLVKGDRLLHGTELRPAPQPPCSSGPRRHRVDAPENKPSQFLRVQLRARRLA